MPNLQLIRYYAPAQNLVNGRPCPRPSSKWRSAEAESNSGSKRRVGIQLIASRYCTEISVVICIVCLADPDHSRPTVWPVWAWNNKRMWRPICEQEELWLFAGIVEQQLTLA